MENHWRTIGKGKIDGKPHRSSELAAETAAAKKKNEENELGKKKNENGTTLVDILCVSSPP